MPKFRIGWAFMVLACLVAGCGGGIETGMPSDMTPKGTNPTPDMGPSPNAPPADAAKK